MTAEIDSLQQANSPLPAQEEADGQGDSQCFAHYDLVRRIAVGGMGEVYLARQRTAFGREVAVKIIRPDLVHDLTARKRFLREAEVSAYLKHDHILPLLEFGEEQGRLFLVTPYIKSGTLAQRLQDGPLSLAEVHELFTALVEAVAYLHKRGVIHRDLKPSNILLDRAEDSRRVYVRLIDFGIAALQGLPANAPLTTSGHEMGTIAYMAPERLDGIAAASNDIYSLGIILYQMITGRLPKADAINSLPKPLHNVITHCVAINPKDRFISADELLTHFEQAYRESQNSTNVDDSLNATLEKKGALALEGGTPFINNRASVDGKPSVSVGTGNPQSWDNQDYEDKTSSLESGLLEAPRRRRKSKISVISIITILIFIIMLTMAGLGYQAFQSAISATIMLSPRVQNINTTFTITAKPGLNTIDKANAAIPARALNSTQTSSLQGATSGKTGCSISLGVINIGCKPAVAGSDIDSLSSQLDPILHTKIDQDLQKQSHDKNATTVGDPVYSSGSLTSDPQVGAASKTVTVTMTEQGMIEYFQEKDADLLALQLLKQKVQKQYILIDYLTALGHPVVKQVNNDGTVQISITAKGVSRYQIPPSELTTIRNQIKGLTRKNAQIQIDKHVNIDPSSINIRVSYGDTLPSDAQQITIETTNPNIPSTT